MHRMNNWVISHGNHSCFDILYIEFIFYMFIKYFT